MKEENYLLKFSRIGVYAYICTNDMLVIQHSYATGGWKYSIYFL